MLVKLAKFYNEPEPVNIGTGFMYRIDDLAAQIAALVEYGGRVVWNYEKPNGQKSRVLDLERMHKLGMNPLVSLNEGLKQTISWYRWHRAQGSS
jgi:GDP-L-fucose synthase